MVAFNENVGYGNGSCRKKKYTSLTAVINENGQIVYININKTNKKKNDKYKEYKKRRREKNKKINKKNKYIFT